ncbi:hypothetical protein GC209_01250 [bacterium]|nr:hypothetical protein [bacterium]
MPDFEFADCPTRLTLTTAPSGVAQEGRLTCSVKSTASRRVAVRLQIKVEGQALPDWFRLDGAVATNPREIEVTFEPDAVVSATVAVRVPAGTPPQSVSFRLRAISEKVTDTDFVEAPQVSFDVAPWSAPPDRPAKVPWWAFAVIAAVAVAMLAAMGWALWPKGRPDPNTLVDMDAAAALDLARAEKFPNPIAVEGPRTGVKAGRVTSVALAGNGDLTLYVEPGVRIVATPAAVSAAPGTVDLFALAEDQGIYRKHFDGTTWTPPYDWQPLDASAKGEISATVQDGMIDLAATGIDNVLLHAAIPTPGTALGTWTRHYIVSGKAAPFVIRRGGELDIFALDTAGHMTRWSGAAEPLSEPQNWSEKGETFARAPTGVSWGPQTLHLFSLSPDHHFYARWLDGTVDFAHWADFGGDFAGPLSICSWALGRLDVAAIGLDGALHYKAFNGSQWQPSDIGWASLGGSFVDRPAIVTRGPGKLDIFAVGSATGQGGAMFHKSGDGSGGWIPAGTGWDDLGGSFVGAPVAVVSGPDRIEVFGRTVEGTIYQKTFAGSGPSAQNDGWNRIDSLSSGR